MKKLQLALLCGLLGVPSMLLGEVSLPKIMSSHMVLQRDKPLHVWGSGAPGETIKVDFHGATGTTTTDDLGRWSLYFPAQAAGGPYTLTVQGTNTITLDDILVGDLWMASGQSNMEMPLKGFGGDTVVKDADAEIRNADHPQIRLLMVTKKGSSYPLEDVSSGPEWVRCTPETAKDFSAVAYFFGRSLQQHEKVPIGLIDSSWGGTPADSWTSMDALSGDAALTPVFAAWAAMIDREATGNRMIAADQATKAKGQTPPTRPWHPELVSYQPAALYNAMIAPFIELPIRGVIWYQGETNSALNRAPTYARLFPAMIEDWRKQWQDATMPFLFVQLASFTSTPQEDWPTVREAQRTTLALRNTGMAVAIDVGLPNNVHPPDKQVVGERLALWARSISYGEKLEYSGPLFRQAVPMSGSMQVEFDHGSGLTARGGALKGFEVAGADRVFVAATANLQGDKVMAGSPSVTSPRYVRYAWRNYPEANLYNREGLPASPFTSLTSMSPVASSH